MAKRRKPIDLPGVKYIPLPDTRNIYTSYGTPAVSAFPSTHKTNQQKRNAEGKAFTKQSERIIKQMEFNQSKALEVVKGGPGLGATRRARQRAEQGAPVFVFDTENLGRVGAGKSMDEENPLFAITQVSFAKFPNLGAMKNAQTEDVKNVVFGLPKKAEETLRETVKSLRDDPMAYFDLDQRTKESLGDLVSMSNPDYYGGEIEVDGKLFRTISGQAQAAKASMAVLTRKSTLDQMESGLDLLTNPKLVTDPRAMTDLVNSLTSGGAVGIGHNVEAHDQLGLEQHLRSINAPEETISAVRNGMVDTLSLANHVVNSQQDMKSDRNTLGALYQNITNKPYGDVMAHNASDDVLMNIAVGNKLLERTVIGRGNESELIYPGDKFQVDSGINFFQSDFNKNEGQYDMVTKINPETGKHELQYKDLQRGTGRGDRILEYVGATEPTEIDGVQHFGVEFYNEAEDTYHSFFRRTESGIDDLFNQNLVRAGEMSESKAEYIKSDRARRRYLELFSTEVSNPDDTVSERLGVAYNIIETYDEIKAAAGEDASELSIIQATRDRINETKKNPEYPYGISRIEDVVYLKDKLEKERPLWQDVARKAKGHAGVGSTPTVKAKRENMYMNEIFNALVDSSEPGEYGYDGMEMIKLRPITTVGSESHRNIESKSRTRSFVRSQLTQDLERALEGKPTTHTDRLFEVFGENLTEERKSVFQEKIERDMNRGRIAPGTVNEIADFMYKNKQNLARDGHLVNSVPGLNIQDPLTTSNLGVGGIENLFGEAGKIVDKRVSRRSGRKHEALADKRISSVLKRSDEIAELFREGITDTNQMITGFKGGPNIFKKSNMQTRLEKTMQTFEDKGFQVRLEQIEGTGGLMLFTTPDKDIDFSSLNFSELDSHKSVSQAVIPLFNENYAINTSLGDVRDIQKATIKGMWDDDFNIDNITANDVEVVSASDRIMREIESTPYLIEKSLKEGHTVEDAVKKSNSRITRVSADSGVPSGYRSFTAKDIGYEAGSRDKNRMGMLDMSDYQVAYAKQYRPDEYKRYMASKEAGGSDNFTDYLDHWGGDRVRFDAEMRTHYQEKVGVVSNVGIYADGRNPTQVSRGLWNMVPSTINNPSPSHHMPSREQGGKTPNYRAINREILEGYLKGEYGEDSMLAEMTANPAQNRFTNIAEREKDISSYEIDILRTGDKDLSDSVNILKKRYTEEKNKLTSKPTDLTGAEKQRLEELERLLNITSISPGTFEDGYLIAEEFASNIVGDEFIELDLDGYELDSNLESFIRDRAEIGAESDFNEGKYLLKQNISMEQLKELGVVDSDDYLTIGKLQKEFIRSNDGSPINESRKKRLQPDASVYGLTVNPDGSKELLIENPYVASSGLKTVGGESGVRETGFFVPQQYIDDISNVMGIKGNVQAIKAFEKMGPGQRGGTASAYSEAVRTSTKNIGLAIEELHKTGESDLDSVNEFFKDGLGGNAKEDYHRYIEEQFVGEINEAVGTDYLRVLADTDDINNYEFNSFKMEGTTKERQESLKKVFGLATEKYGLEMDETSAVVRSTFRVHNIDTWAGTGVKAKYGRKEFNILSQITRGPTEEQEERIRKLGTLGGKDYSNFKYDIQKPGDSIILQNYYQVSNMGNLNPGSTLEDLKNVGMDRREQEQYARSVRSSVQQAMDGITEEDIQLGGNVIVDASGAYSFEEGSNILTIGEGSERYHVIDGQSVRMTPDGMPSGAELKGSYGNLHTVNVYSDDMDTTIGDLVKEQNSKVYVKMMDPNNPLSENAMLENNVVEAIPMLSGKRYGDTYQMGAERAQTKMFEAAHKLSYGLPDGELDKDSWVSSQLRMMTEGSKEFKDAAGKFLGSSATKDYETIEKENSMSFFLSGRNIFNTEYRAQDFVVSEKDARTLIQGQTDTILMANETKAEDIVKFSGFSAEDFEGLSSERQGAIREDYIIDQITGVKDNDSDFEVFSLYNRQPSQDEGSIIGGSLRVDTTGEFDGRNASIDPRVAARSGGDFDGDAGYFSTYAYLHFDTPERAIALQKELSQMTDMTVGLSLADNHDDFISKTVREGKNTYQEIMELTKDSDIDSVFADNINDMETILQITSDESMQMLVGSTYHSVSAVKDALQYTTDASSMMDTSKENLNFQRVIQSEATSLLSQVQQESISKKKMGLDQILKYQGFKEDDITPSLITSIFDDGKLVDYAEEFTAARNALPQSIRNMSEQSASSLHEELIKLDILNYSKDKEGLSLKESHADTFRQIGRRNDAWGSTALGSFGNIALRHGESSANENEQDIINKILTNPESVPFTPGLAAMAQQQIGDQPDKIAAWKESSKRTTEEMLSAIGRLDEKAERTGASFADSSNLLKQVSESSVSGNYIRSQSSAFNKITEGATSMMASEHFRTAAGIAAGWTAARVMSKGPTPEGNLAEREQASPQEIAPSQLLTSPTARVTPGAENINLSISAQGNLSEEEAATIVNNEIGQMTGTPMNMNITKTDNTAKLDNRFYQKAVDGVFGF